MYTLLLAYHKNRHITPKWCNFVFTWKFITLKNLNMYFKRQNLPWWLIISFTWLRTWFMALLQKTSSLQDQELYESQQTKTFFEQLTQRKSSPKTDNLRPKTKSITVEMKKQYIGWSPCKCFILSSASLHNPKVSLQMQSLEFHRGHGDHGLRWPCLGLGAKAFKNSHRL